MSGRTARGIFRLALRVYPPRFRRAFAADMDAYFHERWQASHGRLRRARLLSASIASVLVSAALEWLRSSLDGRPAAAAPRAHHGLTAHRGGLVQTVLQDVKYAFRTIRRQPAFCSFVVLTLAIGIGANTAVFSVVDGVLLKPLPFPESDRLLAVWGRFDPESGFDFPQFPLSAPELVDYRSQARAVQDVAGWNRLSVTVGGGAADPERVVGAAVTPNFFSLLGVPPLFGRGFTAEEARPNGPPVVVLSYGYWQSRFGGDRGLVGRDILLNARLTTVVGVMPEGFAYPASTSRMWVPLPLDPANPGNRQAHGIRAIARLAPGVELRTARAELESVNAAWKAAYPDIHTGHYLFIRPLLDDVAGSVRPALMVLLGATGFVLIIVCANLATVIMARGEARSREMAIRGALGARKGRLVLLSLVESTILAACGGVLAVAVAQLAVWALLALDPGNIPRASEVVVDARMLAFTGALAVASALLFGLSPAFRGARPILQSTLRETSQSTAASPGGQWVRRGLVAVEVALTVVLLIGAGLMLRSFDRLRSVEPGFEPGNVLMASVGLPAAEYMEPERVEAFYSTLISRIRELAGVRTASATTVVPLWSDTGVWDFEIAGRPRPGKGALAWNAGAIIVRDGFFETLSIPMLRGRSFAATDHARSMPVTIVNQEMVSRFFHGLDPIGQRIRVASQDNSNLWMTIVGIAANVRDQSLDEPPRPVYYIPHSQTQPVLQTAVRPMSLLVRAEGTAAGTVAPAVRAVVRQLDPKLAVFDVQTFDSVVQRSVARPRFTTTLLAVFALLGVALGASGIYGVLAYTVARRTQEIGIRRALGAAPRAVLGDVLARGLKPVVAGLLIGFLASFWTSRLLASQLFEISPADVPTYLAVAVGVMAVALIACAVPVRRALRVNPIVALRSE